MDQNALSRLDEAQTAIANLSGTVRPDPLELTNTMLLPTVQLNGDDTVGSGTLVFSGKSTVSGKIENYVLTSYHVVRNILSDTPRARHEGFDVTIYSQDDRTEVKGEMVAHNARIDAAVVKLHSEKVYPFVARIMPLEMADKIKVWEPVYAVGCPLGNDPVPSAGELSSKNNFLNGANYWMINAPTYFGNSGGGVFLADSRYLIGVFSKIYTHGKGTPVVVPHMGLCTPITNIHKWLEEENLEHLLGPAIVETTNLAAPGK